MQAIVRKTSRKHTEILNALEIALPLWLKTSSRGFMEVFSKEKREERRQRLKEELQKGHFDDFKQLRDTKGKLYHGSTSLIPKLHAKKFPVTDFVGVRGQPASLPHGHPVLVCAAFRDGAQPMINMWAKHFDEAFSGSGKNVGLVEVSLVESLVMSLWPFRSMLMANGARHAGIYGIDSTYVFLFRDVDRFQRAMEMPNRLIGYVYLLDDEHLIRWRGCGFPEEGELQTLVSCTDELLLEKNF